jgi:hypothetical protein
MEFERAREACNQNFREHRVSERVDDLFEKLGKGIDEPKPTAAILAVHELDQLSRQPQRPAV